MAVVARNLTLYRLLVDASLRKLVHTMDDYTSSRYVMLNTMHFNFMIPVKDHLWFILHITKPI